MKKACVIGWPIEHSRSPIIHGYWLKHHNIDGAYDKRAVRPEELPDFLANLAAEGLAGCNVTIPHKQAVFCSVTVTDGPTSLLGAVNTVYLEDGRLMGLNTDGIGFMTHLHASNPSWQADQGAAVVLGAGGAAQAVVAALCASGVQEVRLVNRTRERAAKLARKFKRGVKATVWEERSEALENTNLLVNTTSLGMAGAAPLDISLDKLPVSATVYDIVYVPLMTPLLSAAKHRGHTIVDGLGMLLHQAVPGFELWFGVRPEVTPELRAIIVADIETGT